jgi:Acyl-CoA dehydrogenase, C-terminal domain
MAATVFCTDAALKIALDAMQIHGGYGYIHDYYVEKIMRDVKVLRLLGGSSPVLNSQRQTRPLWTPFFRIKPHFYGYAEIVENSYLVMVYFCSSLGTYHLMKLYSRPMGAGSMPRKRLWVIIRASGT